MTSFTLNLISVKVSFHDIFKKTLKIIPINITSFTVYTLYFVGGGAYIALFNSTLLFVCAGSISITHVMR